MASEKAGWSKRRCPLPDQPILRDSKGSMSFTCKPTNPYTPYHLLIYFPRPRSPRARHQVTRDQAQSPPKLFKLSTPPLAQGTYPVSPIASHENPNKGSGLRSSFSPLRPPGQLWSFPTWPHPAWHALFSLEI